LDELELRELIAEAKAGRVSRRDFTRRMVGLGLTPFATQLLAHAGLAQSPAPADYRPTHAGGGGALRTLFWQAPTSLNPHFAVGAKDVEGAGIFYEPLASWDPDGNLVPMLAAEIPNIENGGVASDGMSVTWKLKTGVQRSALYRRRRRIQLGICLRPGDRRDHDWYLPGRRGRKGRYLHRARSLQEADAVLGRSRKRSDHPQTSVRALQRRQFARSTGKPETSRNWPLPVCGFRARRFRERGA
jgi:hypothetical protein